MESNFCIDSAVIVTHVFATGPAQELEFYLKNKIPTLLYIGHPFIYAKDIESFCNYYLNNRLIESKRTRKWFFPEPLIYLKDFSLTLFWIFSKKRKFDCFIGADPLNAFSGIVLMKTGFVKKVIFYTIDYVPKRFNNKFLNYFYHSIDKFCVTHSSQTWNLSERMSDERFKNGIINRKKQIVVPIGVNFLRINRKTYEKINRRTLVYLGHLRHNQGLELSIGAVSVLKEVFPDLQYLIIGTGELEQTLFQMVVKKKLERTIHFLGYIQDHSEIEEIISRCAVGLAMYEPTTENFSWNADPSKPKQYLACGLPVIMTKVPWYAPDIDKFQLGKIVSFNLDELVEAIILLFTDDNFFIQCKRNAEKYSEKLDWNIIFQKAFNNFSSVVYG